MKNLSILFLIISLAIISCSTQPDSKAIRKEVLNIHDKLMVDGEKVITNKMKLDSVLKFHKLMSKVDSYNLSYLISRLNKADENMMDWMHFFKADFKGKNEQEDLEYYKSEMIRIRAVEDSFIKVTRESDSVLKKYKVVSVKKTAMNNHKH